ncbi:MAG: adenylyl-sulfate kinase [Opitutae bacterium]|mgnify:FL=1|nr:adenylyl-sulfate kinase [Opitutae bacterium]MBT5691930.1 adenylyl-sulfate kinase [Opitutae bacterium]MBT6461373.1 adenylyl-sulfate kinase [Opitutae bacterium]MBT7854094.1 adenylyl-sulfate kinase [Opitutae bacterium]
MEVSLPNSPENIHPLGARILQRADKEGMLNQHGGVMWFTGLSGSGKSSVAIALEKKLHAEGFLTQILDGDNIRTGLNSNLGFTDEDRLENIRRIAEVAKLFAHAGMVVLCSFITPREELRRLARQIVGESDYLEVFVKASFTACEKRDVKGLYAKAKSGQVTHFTGKDSEFEEPGSADITLDTESETIEQSCDRAYDILRARIL